MDFANTLLPQSSIKLGSLDPRQLAVLKDNSDDDGNKNWLENSRIVIKSFLDNSFWGKCYRYFFLALSIISCFQYIYQTYINDNTSIGRFQLYIFLNLELCIAVLFIFDWCLELFVADYKIAYFTR